MPKTNRCQSNCFNNQAWNTIHNKATPAIDIRVFFNCSGFRLNEAASSSGEYTHAHPGYPAEERSAAPSSIKLIL
jgi:hypothetical protein